MGNISRDKIIKIYGVTLPLSKGVVRSYGFGLTKINEEWVAYVDYFIDDLVSLIKQQGLEKQIIDKLTKQKKLL